ncbi:RagB/SusD family nutrient uptake outer membrane protein [bacterium]|nr:RagB/SusD family nutrient uptake outer membrane protein [bacterium]
MKRRILTTTLALAVMAVLSGCTKDLNLSPRNSLNAAVVYEDPANYIKVLAKIYGGLVLSGNEGPAGNPDIADIDEGFSPYLRVYWNLQEIPTDEAVCGWNDTGIPELNSMAWGSSNSFVKAMYSRLFFQITLCNEFIRQCADDKMDAKGFSEEDKNTIRQYRHEARFLRALSWYHAMDLFGNVPFVTEQDEVGAFYPEQIKRADLYKYIESELKEVEGLLKEPKTNEYGRVDKAAAWFLLAQLYLNSEVYISTARYTECATYCDKIIGAGYSLHKDYQGLFLNDNNTSPEIIMPLNCDGQYTKSYGNMTFLVHAFVGGSMNPDDFGINGGWGGYRATKAFTQLFTDTANDGRFIFYTKGQKQSVDTLGLFSNGWAQAKYKNVNSDGVAGSDPTGNFVDNDFPFMRLAEVYLMYAECAVRGGADAGKALGYINQLRQRAYGNTNGNVTAGDLTDDFILAERGRELQWEGKRRTDLIRFGKFTGGSYLWEFKGGTPEGTSVADYLNLYPLSADDLVANPNLVQNPGY